MRRQKRKIAAYALAVVLAVSSLAVQPFCIQAATISKATAIELNMTKKTLEEGQSVTLKITKVSPEKASKAVTWKTSNKKIATVTGKGKVTAKKAGTATITAVSKSNKKVKAVCKITVKQKSNTSGTYKNTKWSIDENGLLTVTGTGNMSNGENGELPPWYECREKIKSAKIEVKGATNLSGIFGQCKNLKSVDFSDFDTANVTGMDCMFFGCSSLNNLDLSNFDTSNVTNMVGMFLGCSSLTSLDLSNFDTSNVTDMFKMFLGCSSLTSLDLSNFDTSNVTDMSNMFSGCSSLEKLNLSSFDTRAVEYGKMEEMLSGCNALSVIHTPKKLEQDITLPQGEWIWLDGSEKIRTYCPAFNMVLKRVEKPKKPEVNGDILYSGVYNRTTWTIDKNGLLKVMGIGNMSKGNDKDFAPWYEYREKIKSAKIEVTGATNLCGIFYQCENLESVDLSKLDTSEVESMFAMFLGCSKLKSVDVSNFDTSNVTNISGMFKDCGSLTTLDVSKFNTEEVTDMSYMFSGCSSLTALDVSKFDTSNVTNISGLFNGCKSLTTLDVSKFNTEKVTDMSYMFSGCSSLTALDVSKFDTSNVTNISSMFKDCNSLTALDVSKWDIFKVTNMESVFQGCSKITEFDFSNFDISGVTKFNNFLESCNSLVTIHTPKKSGNVVPYLSDKWRDGKGTNYTGFPQNATESSILYRLLASGEYENIKWIIDKDGLLEVKGIGDMYYEEPQWKQYCEEIKSAKILVNGATNLAGLFKECSNLISVDFAGFDVTNVTDMSELFYGCNSLTSLDLSNFDTTNVKNMNDMLKKCDNLTTIHTPKKTGEIVAKLPAGIWKDSNGNTYKEFPKNATESIVLNREPLATPPAIIGNLIYSGAYGNTTWSIDKDGLLEVKGIGDMYDEEPQWKQYCEEIKSARVEVTGVTNLTGMFAGCSNLSGVDLSKMDASNVTNAGSVFSGCKNLTSIQSPIKLNKNGISLPNVDSRYYWVDENGNELNKLPTGNTESISLKRMYLAEVPPIEGDISYSGAYGSTAWTINKDGLLEVKGTGDMYEYDWPGWNKYVKEIKSARIEVTGATHLEKMFSGCENLISVDLSKLDTSKVTDMYAMFQRCESLTTLDLSNFNTSQVTNMYNMFYGCQNLESVDVSKFNTSQVTNMRNMFDGCQNLKSVDVSNFDTSKVTGMSNMFCQCNSLKSLDLSNFDTSQVTEEDAAIGSCQNLRTIKTPKKTGKHEWSLPPGAWRDDKEVYYKNIPKNATQSITLNYLIAHGEYGDVKWTIDENGEFLVTGNGEMYEEKSTTPLWDYVHGSYQPKITSAKVEVTGATKVVHLFSKAKNMTTLDMSNFDMSGVTNWDDSHGMLDECDSLTTIYTPKKTGKSTPGLPSCKGYVWTDSKGTIYTKIPANATESIVLTKVAE